MCIGEFEREFAPLPSHRGRVSFEVAEFFADESFGVRAHRLEGWVCPDGDPPRFPDRADHFARRHRRHREALLVHEPGVELVGISRPPDAHEAARDVRATGDRVPHLGVEVRISLGRLLFSGSWFASSQQVHWLRSDQGA